jgi:nucleotide-binding universal stress UspA family protein
MPEIVCTVLRPESARAVALAGQLAERMSLPLSLIDIRSTAPDLVGPPHAPAAPLVAPGPVADPAAGGLPPAPPPADLEALAHEAGVRPALCQYMEAPPVAAIEVLSMQPGTALLVAADSGGGPLATALSGEPPRSALRDLHAPLVLVPLRDGGRPTLGDEPCVACAVTDDDAADEAVAVAVDLAERLGASLRFMHAGDDEAAASRLEVRIAAALPDGAGATFEVLPPDHAHDLHAWADARGADLLVVGPPRRGALGSALLGSAVHRAAQHGAVPLVVAPAAAH